MCLQRIDLKGSHYCWTDFVVCSSLGIEIYQCSQRSTANLSGPMNCSAFFFFRNSGKCNPRTYLVKPWSSRVCRPQDSSVVQYLPKQHEATGNGVFPETSRRECTSGDWRDSLWMSTLSQSFGITRSVQRIRVVVNRCLNNPVTSSEENIQAVLWLLKKNKIGKGVGVVS